MSNNRTQFNMGEELRIFLNRMEPTARTINYGGVHNTSNLVSKFSNWRSSFSFITTPEIEVGSVVWENVSSLYLWLVLFFISLDPILLVVEIIIVGCILWIIKNLWVSSGGSWLAGKGISTYEVIGIIGSSFIIIIFDLMCSMSEDDWNDFILCGIAFILCFGFGGVIVGLGLGCPISLSPISGSGLRAGCFDILNIFLCLFRIFVCFIRYVFYDLQLEVVDFATQFTEVSGEVDVLWSFFLLGSIGVQIILCLVKLVIASFLLLLVLDLFVIRPISWSVSRWGKLR